jgi:tRNA(Ile)-lysidine synthetase-like protein
MAKDFLQQAIARVPGGAWAVGVSGGADSVALLELLLGRADVRCHVVHLDHETRAGESAGDARFVVGLCDSLGVPCTVGTRTQIEARAGGLSRNTSARFRELRHWLFRDVCAAQGLRGVLLAHHADDQAETILQRLLRGSGPAGLAGMRFETCVGGLMILRPLLEVPAALLRDFLRSRKRAWREDASNASPEYQRNRVRAVLASQPQLAGALRELGRASEGLIGWAREAAPVLGETFAVCELAELPDVLANEAARGWLAVCGAPRDELSAAVLGRLVAMARDAATPPRVNFPGGLWVGRRRGWIGVVGGTAPEGS